MYGKAIEMLMNLIFSLANIKIIGGAFDRQLLINSIDEEYLARWQSVNAPVNWKKQSPAFILDHLYKLDKVIEWQGCLYGLQITGDSAEVSYKRRTLNTLLRSGVYRRIKVEAVVVLLVLEGTSDGYACWSKKEEEKEGVLNQIDDLLQTLEEAKNDNVVGTFILNLP